MRRSLPVGASSVADGPVDLTTLAEREHWYAVHTRSRHEQKVALFLEHRRMRAYVPMLEVWSRRVDRRKLIQKPVFPGYLFVQCRLSYQEWLEILKTPGVARVLGIAATPTPVPDEQIESIRVVVTSGFTIRHHPFLEIGDRMEVISGPLKGAQGILVREDDRKEKLVVSIHLLGRSIAVGMEGWQVRKLG